MTLRVIPKFAVVFLFLLAVLPIQADCAESNEAFVRKHLELYFLELIDSLNFQPNGQLYIDFNPPFHDNLNVTGAALSDAVEIKGLKRNNPDTAKNSEPRVGLILSLLKFGYENRNGTPFSRGDLYRVLQVAGSFSILQGNSVLDEDFLVRTYEDRIELEEQRDLESESSPLFHAELPSGPVQRFWEPVIVTSIIGGLVYLFFASR